MEPAKETLSLVAGQWRFLPALFAAADGRLRGARAGLRDAVHVCGAGDEGVRHQREQDETRRRARPHEPLRLNP